MLTSNIFSSNPISGKLWLKLYMTLFSIILSKCSLVIYSQVTHSSKILRLYLVWKMKRRDKKRCTTCGHHLWEIPVTHTLMSNYNQFLSYFQWMPWYKRNSTIGKPNNIYQYVFIYLLESFIWIYEKRRIWIQKMEHLKFRLQPKLI